MRRQISGRPDGSNPLIYTGSVPNMVTIARRPTIQDGLNWPLGYWWIIPKDDTFTTGEVWILVSVANSIATWKKLHGGGGPTPPSSIAMVNKRFITTTGAGTYTPTTGMVQCYVECQGGGSGAGFNGRAGSAGGYCAKMFTASDIGTSQAYVVGAGGAGGLIPDTGSDGVATTFGSFLTANGGSAAIVDSFAVGGTATGGDINIQGGSSVFGSAAGANISGGSSMLGIGGAPNPSVNTAIQGTGYGSGPNNQATANQYASGSNGIIIITEYIG